MDDRAWVIQREALGSDYFRLRLRAAKPFSASPGQFVMIRVDAGIDPLLRRPFSIHRVLGSEQREFELLFRVVGHGTRQLSRVNVGDCLDALVPLGNGFKLEGEKPLLIGGGIGVAPLMFLAEALLARGVVPKLLLGGRSDRDILCHDEFSCLSIPCEFATEDGSIGEEGFVTKLLIKELKKAGHGASVYACGPTAMLGAVADICINRNIPCQVSLEAHMACGIGACLGCVAPGASTPYLRVCMDGPVFDAREVGWAALAKAQGNGFCKACSC